ncbi:MAG TPA: sigma-54 dependent transcriptional regulator [Candidatus Polarisedimenticolia bacterium]|jgi:DNA-binding NtrC family response regulator|nr:sigma-54 dependent transcriptional regulator [Candidatus Polarisedimenticolia bacterium]
MTQATRKILIVDDDPSLNEALAGLLAHAGHPVSCAETGTAALEIATRVPVRLALVDVRLGGESGLDLLPRLRALRPEMAIIMMTAQGSIEMAVEAMQRGADNFVTKPLDPKRLLALVEKGLETWALRNRTARLERLGSGRAPARLGDSPGMAAALRLAEAVAGRDTTVLLLGETGTGKGMLARHIHALSPRRAQPFVELNCAGLQKDLTESELFGHERGSFTGATEKKIGLFEAADGGTLLLDEIGEMDYGIQAKLLKVLEEGRFRRVGGLAEIEADVRLLAATHRDLDRAVTQGGFRQDLLYRLNVFAIRLPPLRDRHADVLPLAYGFLAEYREAAGHAVPGPAPADPAISEAAARLLQSYAWPGNVRELRNVIERASILCSPASPIRPEHLPPLQAGAPAAPRGAALPTPVPATTIVDAEKRLLEQALKARGGNIRAAARDLGIARGTLYRKAKKYGIALDAPEGPE